MGQHTIGWVDDLCWDWGTAIYRREKVTGYQTEAAISRALQGRGGVAQHFPEVMLPPDARACHAAVMALWAHDMHLPYAACWAKFVYRRSVRRAAAAFGVSTADYRAALIAANAWIAAKVERPLLEKASA